jgi:1-aminocyclopropane-1-carboxylate deaminase
MQSASFNNALQWFSQLAHDKIITQSVRVDETETNGISWDILRTDLIHPVCSGNKFFKLRYYLEDAISKNHTTVHSFGGAWSNHIVATAFCCCEMWTESRWIYQGRRTETAVPNLN